MAGRSMRILVTGGAGYIGSHTALHLQRAGHFPVVLDDLSTGHREFARFGPFVYGDILDERRVRDVLEQHRIDAVIHFAARTLVGEAMSVPEHYLRVNVAGTVSVLTAMKAVGVRRLVYSSSCAVYGERHAAALSESLPPAPSNPYGLSKWLAEQAIGVIGPTFDLRWACLRYFNVVGAALDQGLWEWHEPETHVVPNLLAAAKQSRPFTLLGADFPTPDGTAVRDYVDVRDLAVIHGESLAKLEREPRLLSNVGRGVGVSVQELVTAAQHAWGIPIAVERRPRRLGDPPQLVADNAFLKSWSRAAQQGLRPVEESLASLAPAIGRA